MRRTRTIVTLVLSIGVVAPSLSAQQQEGALDPEIVIADLVATYRDQPTRERITIIAQNEARTQQAIVTLMIDPAGRARFELGDYEIWLTTESIFLLSGNDERGYFRAPRRGLSITETLRSINLPPLPLPQLALAFDPRQPSEIDLLEYAQDIEWTSAFIDAGADRRDLELERDDGDDADDRPVDLDVPPRVVLGGEGQRTKVTVEMDPETSRLRHMVVVVDEGAARLELRVEPEPVPTGVRWEPDLGRREREPSFSSLRPRPGIVLLGDPMPKLKLQWDLVPDAPIQSPGCVVLFREISPVVASAISAARAERDARPGFGVWSALIIDPTKGQLNFRFADAQEWITPDQPYYSISAVSTIDRFATESSALLIVFDEENLVRTIIDLGGPDPSTPFEERAEPVVEKVDELRARISSDLN